MTIRHSYLFLTMSTIFIEKRTREKLRNIGRKEPTYDDIINELRYCNLAIAKWNIQWFACLGCIHS